MHPGCAPRTHGGVENVAVPAPGPSPLPKRSWGTPASWAVVHGLFLDVLRRAAERESPGAWADAAQKSGLPAHPSAVASYNDEATQELIQDVAAAMGMPLDEALERIGRHGAKILAADMPGAFDRHDNVHAFLNELESVIHSAVRSEGSMPPITEWRDGILVYRSERRLGPLAMGLLRGVVDHYGGDESVQPMDPLGGEEVRFRVESHAS